MVYRNNPYSFPLLFFLPIWTIYFLFNVIYFLMPHMQRNFYIKSRSKWLNLFSAIGGYGSIIIACFQVIIGPRNFPNIFTHIYLWVFLPMHIFPYPLRAFQFILKYNVALVDEDSPNSIWKFFYIHHKWITDFAFNILFLILMLITLLWGAIRLIVNPTNHWGHVGTGITQFFFIVVACGFVMCSGFLWFTAYFLRNLHEEIRVNREFIFINVFWMVFVPVYILIGLLQLNIEYQHLDIVPQYLIIFLSIYDFAVTFCYPISLASMSLKNVDSSFGYLSAVKMESLNILLSNPEASQIFYSYLKARHCQENYEFIQAVQYYKNLTDINKLNEVYHKICSLYIEESAPRLVNLRSNDKKNVLKVTSITPSVFDTALEKIKLLLLTDQYTQFILSPEGKLVTARTLTNNNFDN